MTAYDRSAPLDEDDKPDSGVTLKGATPLSRLSRMFFRPCFVPSGFLLLVLLSCLFLSSRLASLGRPPPHFRLLDRLSHPRHPVPSRSSSVTVLCFPLFCPLSLSVLPLLLSPLFLLLRSLVRCSLLPFSFSPRSFRRFLRRLTSRALFRPSARILPGPVVFVGRQHCSLSGAAVPAPTAAGLSVPFCHRSVALIGRD